MAIIGLETELGDTIRAAVFPRKYDDLRRDIHKGRLTLAVVSKNERGFAVDALLSI